MIASNDGADQNQVGIKVDVVMTHKITVQDSLRSRAIKASMRLVDRFGIVYEIVSKPTPHTSGRSRQLVIPCKELTEPV